MLGIYRNVEISEEEKRGDFGRSKAAAGSAVMKTFTSYTCAQLFLI